MVYLVRITSDLMMAVSHLKAVIIFIPSYTLNMTWHVLNHNV